MDRRDFLRGAALGAMGLAGLSCRLPPAGVRRDAGAALPDVAAPPVPALGADLGVAPAARRQRLNLLFIVLDDLNDWVGCLGGHPGARTPHLDALASEGVLFERAYCTSPLCCPSRSSLLTGLMPSTTGVYGNFDHFRASPQFRGRVTLPEHFRANGYRTLMGGKIFHGTHGKFADPASWDAVLFGSCGTPSPPPADRYRHGLRGKFRASGLNTGLDWFPLQGGRAATDDWRLASTAARFLRRPGRGPFMLTCGFSRPHLPWYAPQEFFDLHPLSSVQLPRTLSGDLDDLPQAARLIVSGGKDFELLRDSGYWRHAVRAYLACCSFMDACVGRVIEALENSAYRDNTAVVLLSDHGFHLGEKNHLEKRTLWEESARVPLIVRAPGQTLRGGRCAAPVSLLDIFPTVNEVCGLSSRGDLEGRSLGPLLREPGRGWPWPAVTTYHHQSHAVRSARYRYIRYASGDEELYDHQTDADEWHNLAGDARYAAVKEALAPWLPGHGARSDRRG